MKEDSRQYLDCIHTRHREFALLQSVGMTGKQLKTMLVMERLLLTAGSLFFTFVLILATSPLVSNVFGSMFWFYTYHFTLLPVLAVIPLFLLLGTLLPLITYHYSSKRTIVERLRDAE